MLGNHAGGLQNRNSEKLSSFARRRKNQPSRFSPCDRSVLANNPPKKRLFVSQNSRSHLSAQMEHRLICVGGGTDRSEITIFADSNVQVSERPEPITILFRVVQSANHFFDHTGELWLLLSFCDSSRVT